MRHGLWAMLLGLLAWSGWSETGHAQQYNYYPAYQLNRFYYYPYIYFPHSYWPATSPRWPEQPGMPYMKPPAYQAWPAFRDPDYRYEFTQPNKYHKGFHFWLDQF